MEESKMSDGSSDEDVELIIEETDDEDVELVIEESSDEDVELVIEETDDEDPSIKISNSSDDKELVIEESDEEQNDTYLELSSSDSSSLSKELKLLGDVVIKGEKFKRFEMAINSNIPVNFIVKSKNKIVNLQEEFDTNKNIVFNYNKFLEMGIKIPPRDYLLLYYHINKDKDSKYLIENFNKINEIAGLETFYETNFNSYIDNFNVKYNFLMEKTKEEFKNFNNFYNKIEKFKTLENYTDVVSTFSTDTTTVEYDIKDGDYYFDIENMEIIFDNIKVNNFFSYIRLDDKDKSKYKVFTGSEKKYENFIDFNETIPFENYKLYLFYEFTYQNKYLMDFIKIDLEESKCHINFIEDTLEKIKEQLIKILPKINFVKELEKNISGDFQIKIKNYDETKLYYLTLFSDIFSEFLFIKEDISLRSLKENIKIYYVGTDQYREYLNYSVYFNLKKLHGDNYLINFTSKSSSPILIKEFILILMKLFWYFDNLDSTEIKYLSFVKEPYTGSDGKGLGGVLQNDENVQEIEKSKKIEALMSADKDLFQKRIYVRSCPCPKQPIIIRKEDKEDWENYEVDGQKRNVVMFPPEKSTQKVPKNYYVCPDDEFKIFSLKENPDPSSKYPLIPCCSINNFPEKLYEDYDTILKNPVEYWSNKEIYRGKNKNILKTLKVLNSGRTAVLPDYVSGFINKIETNDYLREGVYKNSKSSFLHCLLKISKDINFQTSNPVAQKFHKNLSRVSNNYNSSDLVKRNRMITNFRLIMPKFSFVNLNVCMQELYDFKIDEVNRLITDSNYNINSDKFFRFFENFFAVNIFVFVYDKELGKSYIETPNYQYYHLRIVDENLPSVFLLKHQRKYSYNVYEIIRRKNAQNLYVFENKFSKFMKNYFVSNISYYTKNLNIIRRNPFSNINWPYILKDYEIVSQMINSSGRTFSLSFRYNSQGDKITLFIQSTVPLNCKKNTDIFLVDKKTAINLFGENYQLGDEGLWYPLNDIKFGFFIPCSDVPRKDKNFCKDYQIIKGKDNKIWDLENIKLCKKNSNIFVQLFRWLYFLEDKDLETWFDTYCVNENRSSKESLVSRSFSIPYRFPQNITSTSGGINYLNSFIPEIFDKKIFMYDDLYQTMYRNLKNFLRVNNGLKIINNKVLKDVLKYELDYKVYDFNKLLIGDNFSIWKNNILKRQNNLSKIEEDYICQKTPFIWKNYLTGKLYFLQNNKDNSLITSLICCKINQYFKSSIDYNYNLKNLWKAIRRKYTKYNFGWTFERLKDYIFKVTDKKIFFKNPEECLYYLEKNHIPFKMVEEYSYLVYSKIGEKINISKKYIVDEKEPLEVFMYSEGGHAAMIPIL